MSLSVRRKWLNLSECSRYLSKQLSETVSVSDVARLIADGELTPSINIQTRVFTRKVNIEPTKLSETLSDIDVAISENRRLLKKEPLIGDSIIQYAKPINDEVINFLGVWEVKPIGAVKREAEMQYSECEGLPFPERSIYDTKGVIISDKGHDYQIQFMIDPQKELTELVDVAKVNGAHNSGFITGHIDKLQKAEQDMKNGEFSRCLVPCISFPEGAYLVIQMDHINEFISEVNGNVRKKPSAKTANLQAELIFALIATTYGLDVARSPRSHFDGKDGVIGNDLRDKGFEPPSGNTVSGWLKNVDL